MCPEAAPEGYNLSPAEGNPVADPTSEPAPTSDELARMEAEAILSLEALGIDVFDPDEQDWRPESDAPAVEFELLERYAKGELINDREGNRRVKLLTRTFRSWHDGLISVLVRLAKTS